MKVQKQKASHPITVILIAGYFCLLAMWNILRMGETIFFWTTLGKYGAHPAYTLLTGGLWAGGCIALVVGLWKSRYWAWVASLVGVICHFVWFWFDRLFMQSHNQNWPFVLTTSTILLIIIIFLLTHKRTHGYFLKVPGI
jgi:hypothetical protein